MLDAYRERFEVMDDPKCRVFEIWLIERSAFQIISNMFESGVRKQYSLEKHESVMCYNKSDVEEIKSRLGVFNAMSGFAYLVDKRGESSLVCKPTCVARTLVLTYMHALIGLCGTGRIRWECHGMPIPEELETLSRVTSELLVSRR